MNLSPKSFVAIYLRLFLILLDFHKSLIYPKKNASKIKIKIHVVFRIILRSTAPVDDFKIRKKERERN